MAAKQNVNVDSITAIINSHTQVMRTLVRMQKDLTGMRKELDGLKKEKEFNLDKKGAIYLNLKKAVANAYFTRTSRQLSDGAITRAIEGAVPQQLRTVNNVNVLKRYVMQMQHQLQQNERRYVIARGPRYQKFSAMKTEDLAMTLLQGNRVKVPQETIRQVALLRKFVRETSEADRKPSFYIFYRMWRTSKNFGIMDDEKWDEVMEEDTNYYSTLLVEESQDI